MILVEITTVINPTEDRKRVQAAVEKIFPHLKFQFQQKEGMSERLVGSGDINSLMLLHDLLRSRKILDTARRSISIQGNVVQFLLNKQAASAGKVNFPADDEPLGSIWVEIVAGDPEEAKKIVDWLAPPTRDGIPIIEIEW